MSTTPEEFFGKGLMEQPPPSPPIFTDDLPQEPNGSSEGQHHVPNEMMLSYVSHVLLDDDIDEQLNNHPALLQVQQPFAQILSSPSSGTNTGSREGSGDFLHEGNVDESELNLALSKGTDAVGAFLKGMEEANGLLPKDNFRRDELVNQTVRENRSHSGVKKRHSRDDHLQVEIRISKAMTVIKEPEDDSAKEMLDDIMLYGYKEVAVNNHSRARELLKQIMHRASETGDATQRLAQCFTKGLEARLVGTGSLLWELLMAERPSVVEFIKASNLYYEACCFNKVALAFSKMTVMQAMVGKSRLHIVDYGLPKPKSYPTEKIEEIGCLLGRCAHEFGLPSFKFHTIKTNWEDACIEDLNIAADEVLVVNDLFSFSTLTDESISFDGLSPRDIVLNNISKMRPHVFIQSVYNCSYGSSFLSRFREMLFYYMAMFDIFDATIPRDSRSRMVLEQIVLGRSAVNALSCEGADLGPV
uniref:Uncharacterized protein n=1 Tax=Saccharum hybrid cultivar R570 TaxID=131158 RepID=A0A059Q3C0_9POAL|nr:hypothetical protein SHCRBa_149_L06_R_280 [Saccharum hybrid cultivar R570]